MDALGNYFIYNHWKCRIWKFLFRCTWECTGKPITYKYYKSIVIQPGDTLWDIALEYKTDDYGSTQEYVDELKEINSLESDSIQESQYLMIAYYDEEFR